MGVHVHEGAWRGGEAPPCVHMANSGVLCVSSWKVQAGWTHHRSWWPPPLGPRARGSSESLLGIHKLSLLGSCQLRCSWSNFQLTLPPAWSPRTPALHSPSWVIDLVPTFAGDSVIRPEPSLRTFPGNTGRGWGTLKAGSQNISLRRLSSSRGDPKHPPVTSLCLQPSPFPHPPH